jgi:TolB-like protein
MRKLIAVLLFFFCAFTVFAQNRPRLAILPFVGGADGDGETIATLFSFQQDILQAFTVVPRTSAINALLDELNFQYSGYTDSDTIAQLGRALNADYVVSGHIRRLGDRNLAITTIVNVETFEMMAGDYREYRNIEEIRRMLPAISQKMIEAVQRDTSMLDKLAVAPFHVANRDVDIHDAETLAQILSIEITNTGRFAVLPRTATMQAALSELEYQLSGYTAEEEAKALGRAANADYVLSGEVRRLGTINLFTVQILHVEDGRLMDGDSRDYRTVVDGIRLMPEIARVLTDRVRAEAEEIARINQKRERVRFWSIGVFAGTSLADPWVTGTVRCTIAPLPYSFLEIGFDMGLISNNDWDNFYTMFPYIHYALFVPFQKKGGWYIGAGGGLMLEEYSKDDLVLSRMDFAISFTTGFNFWNMVDISYTLRTKDLTSVSNKISLGFTYRFNTKK